MWPVLVLNSGNTSYPFAFMMLSSGSMKETLSDFTLPSAQPRKRIDKNT